MKKKDLAKLVGEKTGLSNKDSLVVINKILSCIIDILKEKNSLEIRGFGSFKVVQRKGRRGRIIKTKESVFVPPYKTVIFIPGVKIKNLTTS